MIGTTLQFMGVCPYSGPIVRRFLNAPVSMDFKHRIGNIGRMPVDLREMVGVDQTFDHNSHSTRFRVYTRQRSLFAPAMRAKYLTISKDLLDSGDSRDKQLIHASLNDLINAMIKEITAPVNALLLREYDNRTLHYFACNRERYMLDSVNQNIRGKL